MTWVSILAYAKLVLPVTIFTGSSGVKNEIITAGAQDATVSKGATDCGGDCVAQRVGLICFFCFAQTPKLRGVWVNGRGCHSFCQAV
jgi:hypothetical protein